MRRVVVVMLTVMCVMAALLVHQHRRIAVLEKQNAVLAHDAKSWEEIAMRFERLNHECLQITFGGGGVR